MALVATSPPPMSARMDVDLDLGRGRVYAPGHTPAYASPPASPTKDDDMLSSGLGSGSGSGASNVANAPTSSPARGAGPVGSSSSSAAASPGPSSVLATARTDAQGTGTLRRAKDIAAFNSLLPPAVEFVEGSSRGALASLDGRYEPINASPKAKLNGLPAKEEEEEEEGARGRTVNGNGKGLNGVEKGEHASPKSPKRPTRRDSTSDGQPLKSLYTDPIELSWPNFSRPYGSGLINLGNTCFLNSALQCLLHTPPLLSVLSDHTKGKCRVKNGFCASCSMHQIATDAYSKGRAFVPSAITRNLNAIAKHFRRGRQEDSHEFLRYLIDAMQKSCLSGYPSKIDHKLSETTWVHKIFGGQLRSRVTCQQCGYNSDTYDNILDLSIDIYNCDRLRDALKKFTAIDVLKGADKYKCEKCKRPVNAEKRFTIHDAPVVLTVHLKRFTPAGRKLQHPIRYDDRLALQPFMSDGQFGPSYSLYGVISHAGSGPNSGHYYAHIRGSNGSWYEMNDDSVEQRSGALNMKNAYVLFYIREKGQALEAALNTKSLVNGAGTGSDIPKKRKDAPASEGASPKRATLAPAAVKLSTVSAIATPNSDVDEMAHKKRMDKIEQLALKYAAKTHRPEPSFRLPSLVNYGESESEDEEKGEPVERPGLNGDGKRPEESDMTLSSILKDEGMNERPSDMKMPPSSPICVPPTSSPPLPTPHTSPTDVIAPTNFYGTKPQAEVIGIALKRKLLGDGDDDDDSSDNTAGGRGTGTGTAAAAPPRRTSFAGPGLGSSPAARPNGASPYSRSRFGTNLGATRDSSNDNVFLRKQRGGRKTYGKRRNFMM